MSKCFFVSLGLSPQVTYCDPPFSQKKKMPTVGGDPLPGEIDPNLTI